jgi:hypothetical protein
MVAMVGVIVILHVGMIVSVTGMRSTVLAMLMAVCVRLVPVLMGVLRVIVRLMHRIASCRSGCADYAPGDVRGRASVERAFGGADRWERRDIHAIGKTI